MPKLNEVPPVAHRAGTAMEPESACVGYAQGRLQAHRFQRIGDAVDW